MEDNFTHDEFEEFLRDQVRNQRMYPKDTVWREIDRKLHGEKKWPALTIAALALLSASIIISVYFKPKTNIFAIKPSIEPVSTSALPSNSDNVLNKLTSSAAFGKDRTTVTFPADSRIPSLIPATEIQPDNSVNKPNVAELENASEEDDGKGLEKAIAVVRPINLRPGKQESSAVVGSNTEFSTNPTTDRIPNSASAVLTEKQPEDIKNADELVRMTGGKDNKNTSDISFKDRAKSLAKASIKVGRTKNKFSYQIYVAPSRSYRKLFEDQSLLKTTGETAGPVGLNYVADVNNVVRHKPGTGIEAGISFMYNLSDKVKIKTGFQFNVRQYSIEAYRSTIEVASIALIGRNGIDTINRLAVYRNNNGYYSAELVNRYYQLALPIGVEWEVFGNKKVQFNVAASIQPTYLMNRNAYLLSTNFKNYTESPEMVRSWNINSNIETFVSITAGDFKWQIGPQVRYQPYSTFIQEYPIKEHLLDYGIKIGVSRTIGNK